MIRSSIHSCFSVQYIIDIRHSTCSTWWFRSDRTDLHHQLYILLQEIWEEQIEVKCYT